MCSKMMVVLAIVGLSGAALTAPVAGSATEDRNVAFLLAGLGLEAMPEGTATVTTPDGAREMPIRDAIALAAARADGVDIAAIASGAAPGDGPYGIGDVWVLEFGTTACPTISAVSTGLPTIDANPQLFVYGGAFGTASTDSSISGVIIDWTTKGTTGGAYAGPGTTVAGFSDFFCVSFFGLRIWFPFVTGYAGTN